MKNICSQRYKPRAVDDEEPKHGLVNNLPAEKELKLYDDTMYYSDRKQYLEIFVLKNWTTLNSEKTPSVITGRYKRKFINYYKEKKFVGLLPFWTGMRQMVVSTF